MTIEWQDDARTETSGAAGAELSPSDEPPPELDGESPEHAQPPDPTPDGAFIETSIPEESRSPADTGEAILEGMGRLFDRLTQRLDTIQAALERDARAEATRERVVDRLHAELQEYKQDLLLKSQRPIFLDLIQLHDDIGKMIEARSAIDGELDRAAAVRGILESIQVAIEDILYRQGVEPFTAEADAFDPRRQRAVSTVPTADASRNKTIAARLRKGFQSDDRMIRPEIVSVYTFRPAAPAEAPT